MSAIEDKRAEEFRRHVWAVTMTDENPSSGTQTPSQDQTAAQTPKKKHTRRSSDLV